MDYSTIHNGTVDALAFAAGAGLCAMMAVLQWRSPQVTGGNRDMILLWICGLLWTANCFVAVMMMLSGIPESALSVQLVMTLAWCSTCAGPVISVRVADSALGNSLPGRRWVFAVGALASLGVLGGFLFATANQNDSYDLLDAGIVSFFASMTFAVSAVIAYLLLRKKRTRERARRNPSPIARVVLGFWMVWIALTLFNIVGGHSDSILHKIASRSSQHWVIPVSLLAAVSLARTHYADVVLKRSLVLLFSIFGAGAIAWQIPGLPKGAPLVTTSLIAAALMLSAPFLYRLFSAAIDKYLLKRPDYRALALAYGDAARLAPDRAELVAVTERAVGQALDLTARLDPPAADEAAEVIGLRGGATVSLTPKFKARALMQAERSFLDEVGAEYARRREALAFEAERLEREQREARLKHAVTEARLEALRAQVDPHFLFNTLNAITDLIATDPDKAELMTERLAAFFRYTLNRQEQSLATLDEELDFVRQYLDIEKVRFGDRLKVEIRKDKGLGEESVPSLILQPLVENALRHGLSSKREGGRIQVTAAREGSGLRLEVADNGVGFTDKSKDRVGLTNVRERLKALHGEAASMTIGKGPDGKGASIVLSLPA